MVLHWGPRRRAIEAEGRQRGGVLGVASPPATESGLGSAVSSELGAEPRHRPKVFPPFSALKMASPDTIMLLIVDCSYWEARTPWSTLTYAPARKSLHCSHIIRCDDTRRRPGRYMNHPTRVQ